MVSLELPGNIKVRLGCQCRVIIAVKQSVSFYNRHKDRKKRIAHDANMETELARGASLLKTLKISQA